MNHDRDPPGGGRVARRETLADAGHGLGKVRDALPRRAELVAEVLVVLLEPAGPDAQDQSPTADVVHGACHVRQQVGVAVGVARHEGTDLDAAGLLGPRAEHRPALEVLALRVTGERVEVVPVEGGVHTDVLGAPHGVPDLGIVSMLGLDLHGDAKGVAHPLR